MTMQNTPLLMSRILGRGAELDPEVEVVTAQASGTHRQTLKQTWNRAQQVANHFVSMGVKFKRMAIAGHGSENLYGRRHSKVNDRVEVVVLFQ